MNKKIPCVIENGFNTCYLDSLFIAMFYSPSIISKILDVEPKNYNSIYLQELIKIKFVEPIRRHYSINGGTMNEIRNYSYDCGWGKNIKFIDEQMDVSEYFIFILNMFSAKYIEFEKVKTSDITQIQKEKFPYLPLTPQENNDNIRDMFIRWKNNMIKQNNETYYYKLSNIPDFIPICINRFNINGTKNNYSVDIMKRIKFFDINENMQKDIKWKIHSIICHRGSRINNGHYYSIVLVNNLWYLIDNQSIPSICQIDLSELSVKSTIMTECYMIFYVLE